ncbi:WD repeat-containing protein 26-like [Ooceraea biroi]|uniref:WD repeat-containing protein 26-like n=1 Tax=Ooceraea biroi TaxID=2015173 RepID=UPI000F08AB65|nr:WD repeat-containing protein 26-like [Ooceraea biroi]
MVFEALQTLRNELTPLGHNTGRVHQLSLFMMCSGRDELQTRAGWDGKGPASRAALMDRLQKYSATFHYVTTTQTPFFTLSGCEMQNQQCTYHITHTQYIYEFH